MDPNPLVSVVIPTYNRSQQVIIALDSVLAQDYPNVEVIIVDDGSVAQIGLELRDAIAQRQDNRHLVRMFRQVNQGSSAARNKGIAEAAGEWIAFLDSDDRWQPDKLRRQIDALSQLNGASDACVTDATLTSESGPLTTAFTNSKTFCCLNGQTSGLALNAVSHLAKSFDQFWISTLLVRADLIRQIGGFDPGISAVEDHDCNFRLSLRTEFCFVNKPLVVLDRSATPAGADYRPWDNYEVHLRGQLRMFEKWLLIDEEPARAVRDIVRSNLRNVHSALANCYLENGRYKEAADAMHSATRHGIPLNTVIKWAVVRTAPSVARRIWRN